MRREVQDRKLPSLPSEGLSIPPSQSRRPRRVHCLGLIGDLKLREDVGDMIAHGFGTQDEVGGNIGIGLALRNQGENLVRAPSVLRRTARSRTLLAAQKRSACWSKPQAQRALLFVGALQGLTPPPFSVHLNGESLSLADEKKETASISQSRSGFTPRPKMGENKRGSPSGPVMACMCSKALAL